MSRLAISAPDGASGISPEAFRFYVVALERDGSRERWEAYVRFDVGTTDSAMVGRVRCRLRFDSPTQGVKVGSSIRGSLRGEMAASAERHIAVPNVA